MLLRRSKKTRKTLGFRLIAWYCGLFILTSLALFGSAYDLLSASMQRRDQDAIQSKLRELAAEYRREGIPALERTLDIEQSQTGRDSFVIRVVEPENKTIFLHVPSRWTNLDLHQLSPDTRSAKSWIHISVRNKDDDDDEDEIVEVASLRLSDHATLQVGASTDDREDILERFGHISIGVACGLILTGFGGGFFLAIRALRPFRGLLGTLRTIVATGDLEARAPVAGTGDELDELGVLFNGLLDKIAVLINGMQSALDDVAHDLRTPMTRLRGMAELALQLDEEENPSREALVNCVEESDRILAMLNTLMDISEAETGTMQLNLNKVNVSTILEQVVELYSYVAEDKRIRISVSAPKELSMAADPNRMTQVIANLVDNAIKYSFEGGKVDIDAFTSGPEVVIRVTDNGAGIPPAEQFRIWDRLYRGDKSRSQRGLGLGLSLVKAIAHAHHGRIEVLSEVGRGSQFTLYLPAHHI